jgi:hypothetical protein
MVALGLGITKDLGITGLEILSSRRLDIDHGCIAT